MKNVFRILKGTPLSGGVNKDTDVGNLAGKCLIVTGKEGFLFYFLLFFLIEFVGINSNNLCRFRKRKWQEIESLCIAKSGVICEYSFLK